MSLSSLFARTVAHDCRHYADAAMSGWAIMNYANPPVMHAPDNRLRLFGQPCAPRRNWLRNRAQRRKTPHCAAQKHAAMPAKDLLSVLRELSRSTSGYSLRMSRA